MGAWGVGNFDNDTACDWGCQLEKTNDISLIEATIQEILNVDKDNLDVDLACEGLAAIETIARLMGKKCQQTAYSEAVDRWVQHQTLKVSETLKANALKAIDRILARESELAELWEESDDYQEWVATVTLLKTKIAA